MKPMHISFGIGVLAAAFAAAAIMPATVAHAQVKPGFEKNRDNDRPSRDDRSGIDKGWPGSDSDDENNIRSLRATLNTDSISYGPGRGVGILLGLENIGRNPVVIRQRNIYEYDITIRSRSGETVWQWSRTSGARRQDRSLRLEPGESRNFREIWDQRTNDGRRVGEGTYIIEARIYPKAPITTQIFLGSRDDRPGDGWGRPGDDWDDRNGSLRGEIDVNNAILAPGERVRIEYTVSNRGRDAETLRFNSGQQVEIEVRSAESGRVVWRYGRDQHYPQVQTDMTLKSNGRKTFTAEWRPDRNLRQGTYEIVANLATSGRSSRGAARAQSTVRLEGRGWGRGDYDGWGRDDWDRDDNVRVVSGRDLVLRGSDYIGQRISTTGTYDGVGNNGGGFLRNYWVLQMDGQHLFVVGDLPGSRVGSTVRVTGTVRRAPDGRIYLQAN